MAEIVDSDSKNPGVPQGSFEGWTEGKSQNGQTFYYRAVDSAGETKKPEDDQGHQIDSNPAFSGASCYWTSDTSGSTSTDFANQTGITWYQLSNTIGWTYQLTISSNKAYNYTFNTPNDSYSLDVIALSHTHEVTYTTFNATVTSVDGS